ncbi:sterol desaturase family protein [Bradyrhizobium sp.]|uniref:sterol desaturase family protein n=1 Tax=Bradyrhizobium sp. TaxID=376 RepID=UPI003C7E9EF5
MSGIQLSLVQAILQNLPYILVGGLLAFSPRWVFWAVVLKNTIPNDFMHLNVWWGNRWLEWIIVTPRFHHIHHSENPAHYNRNLRCFFQFGTTSLAPTLTQRRSIAISRLASASRFIQSVS